MSASPLSTWDDKEWSISSFSATCDRCGRSSEPGDVYYSALVDPDAVSTEVREAVAEDQSGQEDTPDEENETGDPKENGEDQEEEGPAFLRVDYCQECWEGAGSGTFSFWKTDVPEPETDEDTGPDRSTLAGIWKGFLKSDDTEEREAAERTRIMDGDASDRRQTLLYLITLMLLRKGFLALEEEFKENDQSILAVRVRGSRDELYEIREPNFTEDDMAQVKDELAELLDMDDPESNEGDDSTESKR